MRVYRWTVLAGVAGLASCASDEPRPPPPVASAGTGGGASTTTALTPEPVGGGGGGVAAHCQVAGAGDSDSASGNDGFKFDVGSPDGGFALPIACEAAAAQRTNLGCEFFAVDLPNDPRGTFMSEPAAEQQFAIAVGNPSGLAEATVQVFLPGEEIPFASGTIAPGQARTFELPSQSINAETTTSDGLAYRITSDTPVTAYQFNPLDNTVQVYSNDASLLLPVHALGTEYTAVTGNAVLLGMGEGDTMPINAGAFVSVVATEDGTTVYVEPSGQIVGELAGAVALERGEVLTIISSGATNSGNLSGTLVRANAPVAVFGGNVATAEPSGARKCCADHMEHQLPPLSAWGSRYVVAPPERSSSTGDEEVVYRITGAFAGTELEYCPTAPPGAPTTLGAAQTVDFATDRAFSVRAVDPEHTFSVTQFLQSAGVVGDDGLGDPAMLVVPAAVQLETRIVFVVPEGYAENRVTLVTQAGSEVLVDDVAIDASAWRELAVLDGIEYSFTQIEVLEGQHFVEGDTRVGVSVYGFDEAVSYAYPGGSGLRIVSVPPAAG